MFRFSAHPAAIGISEGIQDAFSYLQVSWRSWLPVVVLIAACSFVAYAIVGSIDTSSFYTVDSYTNQIVWNPDASGKLAQLLGLYGLVAILTDIGGWVFYAVAVAGLRNGRVTVAGILIRGLITVLSAIVVAIFAILGLIALVAITVLVPAVGLMLFIAAIPFTIYMAVRLAFASMAIFDGFGPIDGLIESWRLSNGAVGRLFGWGVTAALIGVAISVLGGVLVTPFTGAALEPLARACAAGVSSTGSCLTIFMMAVVYESQRARLDPTIYGPVPGPVYPGPFAGGPGWPGGSGPYSPMPGSAGPTPGWPGNAGPYPEPYWPGTPGPDSRAAGSPGIQSAIPGWVGPTNLPAWPADPNAPQPPEAGPDAGPFAAQRPGSDPTNPPASS